jgi:SARP family transcriptional regulator, regulator of embCAB operon
MLRIYLSGPMTVEAGDVVLRSRDFPGRQGREAFAYLAMKREQLVVRSELADALWPRMLPSSWDVSLSSLVSKLRGLLGRAGLDGSAALRAEDGCYALELGDGAWIDHDAALDAVHEAEAALGAGEPRRAYGPSAVAQHIARRPFLPGVDAPWIEARRDRLEDLLIRALECRAEIYLWNEEPTLAVEVASEAIARRPFRESGYRLLMRGHAASGNCAEALRVYERCRMLISDELGVGPSPETKEVHEAVLAEL